MGVAARLGGGRSLAALCILQLLLLSIGLTHDYRLKHEDNNALHATFARSHIRLGLATTHGQNYFYNPATRSGSFYPNHPPGPGLVLAVAYGVTGHDGPAITRAVAIAFHMAGTLLFLGLARRVLRAPWEVFLAVLLYVVLPESAYFGRMVNHEVLALPGALLLVRGYWEAVHGRWSHTAWMAAIAVGATWAAFNGWMGLFAIAACALHATSETFVRRNARAALPLAVLMAVGSVLFVVVVGLLLRLPDTDVSYLRTLFASRAVGDDGLQGLARSLRYVELHWRYFGITSMVGLLLVGAGAFRRRGRDADPTAELASIFLVGGVGYAWRCGRPGGDCW